MRFKMRFALTLFRLPSFDPKVSWQQMASGNITTPRQLDELSLEDHYTTAQLRPDWGHAASLYQVHILWGVGEMGWWLFRASISVNAVPMPIVGGASDLPGAVYVATPTDMPTEILRFNEIRGPQKPHIYPQEWDQAAHWLLTIRRDA